jgi:hypothetical protein
VKCRHPFLLYGLAFAAIHLAFAQGERMTFKKVVEAGSGLSVQNAGSGKAALYLIGPGEVLKRDLQPGQSAVFSHGSLCNAGHYLAVLTGDSFTETGSFDVVPANKPANLSFIAKPSRLPVGLHDGITGAVFVFDGYRNLIAVPTPVSFELSTSSGAMQKHIALSHDGAAWSAMDSTSEQGTDRFVARVGDLSSTRVVGQVPGDPCGLKMSARQEGQKVHLMTDPVRDCLGNAVPDGTIVTFTENYGGAQSTIDAPLKHGIAEVTMAVRAGATFSVASGVVMGNQIGWIK